jgi:endonuclease YncB( thermonuclease family)
MTNKALRCGTCVAASLVLLFTGTPALAAAGSFEPQGEGHVAAVTDARGFRLEDGREVRLAGIEPASSATTGKDRTAALAAIVGGHDVTLRGKDDAPDRYGRQVAFCILRAPRRRCRSSC